MSSVIIVEGDDDLRDLLVQFVRGLGVNAILATDNGAFALQIMRCGSPPTLVLPDIHLPKTGLSVLAAIRADPKLATVPVVSMSAERHASPRGVVAHLRLPEEVGQLASTLFTLHGGPN